MDFSTSAPNITQIALGPTRALSPMLAIELLLQPLLLCHGSSSLEAVQCSNCSWYPARRGDASWRCACRYQYMP